MNGNRESRIIRADRAIHDLFDRDRHLATLIILGGSFVLIAGLLLAGIIETHNKGVEGEAKLLATILPVVGAWVGGLIAFYFSKDSFQAGAKAAKLGSEIAGGATERLENYPVTQVMIKQKEIPVLPETKYKQLIELNLPLKDITDFMETEKIRRLPIFDENGAILYLIHKNMVDEFTTGDGINNRPNGSAAGLLKFRDFLESGNRRYSTDLKKSFGFVSNAATLAEAKEEMDTIRDSGIKCRDIFVTMTGKSSEPIEGWITDDIIFEK